MKNKRFLTKHSLWLVFLLSYLGTFLFFRILSVNLFISDAKNYWLDSLTLNEPFHRFHMPGFPFFVAFLRTLTFSRFSPLFYLQVVALISFAGALYLFYRINQQRLISTPANNYALLLFMLYPMVGMVYIIFPVADALVFLTFFAGVFFFQKEKYFWGSLAWSATLLVHKALWVFVAFAWLFWGISHFREKRFEVFVYAILITTPLLLYTFLGALYHGNLLWILSSNLSVEVASRGTFPVFDGVTGTFQQGGIRGMVKGGLLLFQYLVALWMLAYTLRKPYIGWEFGLAIVMGIILLMTFINQYEIWATLRFGRLLAFPLASWLDDWLRKATRRKLVLQYISYLLGGLLYISQLFYAWYFQVYFS